MGGRERGGEEGESFECWDEGFGTEVARKKRDEKRERCEKEGGE